MSKTIAAALAAAMGLGLAAGAAAQVVVLAARGPSAPDYPAGTVLPASRVVTLKAGDTLELLDSTGSHVLQGPLSRAAGAPDPRVQTRLAEIFLKSQATRPGLAATRGFTSPLSRPASDGGGLWQTPAEGGAACLAAGQGATIGRGPMGRPGPTRITREASGQSVAIDWPSGWEPAPWPAALPTTEGERYALTADDGSHVELVWREIGPVSGDLAVLAQALAAKGCNAQLDRLAAAQTR